MKTALPVPSINYIPDEYKGVPEAIALTSAIDRALVGSGYSALSNPSQVGGIFDDLLGMGDMYRPEAAPAALVAELGYMLSAPIFSGDTDRQKRQKAATAVHASKSHGLWSELKPVLDAITGFSSSLFGSVTDSWAVRVGDNSRYLSGYNWMMRGGAAPADGIIRTGGTTVETITPGVIAIDLGSSTLLAMIPQIVATIKYDYVPVFFRIFLGYTTTGVFTAYAGGQIG